MNKLLPLFVVFSCSLSFRQSHEFFLVKVTFPILIVAVNVQMISVETHINALKKNNLENDQGYMPFFSTMKIKIKKIDQALTILPYASRNAKAAESFSCVNMGNDKSTIETCFNEIKGYLRNQAP